ncbi:hypothetical protein GCM10023317_40340 [Actinopolymorpha pittospori]
MVSGSSLKGLPNPNAFVASATNRSSGSPGLLRCLMRSRCVMPPNYAAFRYSPEGPRVRSPATHTRPNLPAVGTSSGITFTVTGLELSARDGLPTALSPDLRTVGGNGPRAEGFGR